MFESSKASIAPVNSYNEWDPLEEVIVGTMEGATVPEWDLAVEATMPGKHAQYFKDNAGQHFRQDYLDLAIAELDDFAALLARRGIKVVRPDSLDKAIPYSAPGWSAKGGLYSAMPRDSLLVIGDLIIEAPMAWRSRYFETDAFRPLLKQYFHAGARWISAPKPQLLDQTYNPDYDCENPFATDRFAVSEFEPTFDAADFIRCGKDIFVQKSHVTNDFGIQWVRQHIGSDYTVHKVNMCDSSPMHIDASLMPLAPGKLMINANRVPQVPAIFKDWEVRAAPAPILDKNHTLYMSSAWLSMNVLMLDPKTVVVESHETPILDMLDSWGFNVVPVNFQNVIRFGGAFHCVTCDVRRTGALESYF